MFYLSIILSFLFSIVFTGTLCIFINLSSNLLWLNSQGFDGLLGIFPSSLIHDIANGLLFYQVVGIALTLGFVIAGILRIFIPLRREFSYGLAGLTGILVMLIGLRIPFYGAALIAGARSSLGFILFLLSGLLGGYIFGKLVSLANDKFRTRGSNV